MKIKRFQGNDGAGSRIPTTDAPDTFPRIQETMRTLILLSLLLAGNAAPSPTPVRVLFDDAHYNVHTSDGRYKPFVELARSAGLEVRSNQERFTASALAGSNVLVIAGARGAAPPAPLPERGRPAFTPEEADAIRDWVKAGGGLLLITDHYPLGSANQTLASRFGVTMSNAWADDPAKSDRSVGGLVFSRENGGLADHPITDGVNRVATFTGQSLAGPSGSVPLLRFGENAVDRLPPDQTQTASAAGRAQGIALEFGKGRVVVLGEAAMLTASDGADQAGGLDKAGIDNRRLALNVLRWLAGSPAGD